MLKPMWEMWELNTQYFMGKLPSFTRVEVYERCLCILNLTGGRKVWALMRQKVVRGNEEKTQLKVEQKRLHWNLGEGEERGGGGGNRGLNNKGMFILEINKQLWK